MQGVKPTWWCLAISRQQYDKIIDIFLQIILAIVYFEKLFEDQM